MPTTIKLKNSVTTTNAPSSLAQGEVAINITDKKVWVGNAATTPVQLLGDGGSASFTSIAFGAGTVSNPSITFTGDTNTGIYSPAADTIAFTEGGVEAMRIDSSGNVGINTTTTFAKLSVEQTGGNTLLTRFNSGNARAGIYIGASAGSPFFGYNLTHSSGNTFNFDTNGFAWWIGNPDGSTLVSIGAITGTAGNAANTASTNATININTSGNVGIGTNTPTSKLDVVGQIIKVRNAGLAQLITANTTANANWEFGAGSDGNGFIYTGQSFALTLYTSGGERMRINANGSVGIGTTTSANNLLTLGNVSGVTTANLVSLQGANNISNNLGNCIEWGHSNASGYRSTFGAWVGTGMPFIGLCCEAGTNSNTFRTRGLVGTLIYNDTNGATVFSTVTNANADNQTPTERMRIDSSGNVGIGTSSPAVKLEVNGTGELLRLDGSANQNRQIYLRNVGTSTAKVFTDGTMTVGSNAAYPLTFITQDAERMRIDSSGYLLVGTTSASSVYSGSSTVTMNTMVAQAGFDSLGLFDAGGNPTLNFLANNSASTRFRASSIRGFLSTTTAGSESGVIGFYTANAGSNIAERMRITSGGDLLVGTTATQNISGVNTDHTFIGTTNTNRWVSGFINNSASSPYGLAVSYTGSAPNATGNQFLFCRDTVGTRFEVRSNGGIANYSANDVNLSDEREKTNIQLAGSYLDKICAIPVKTFNYIDQNLEEDGGLTLGVIAQDVQKVAPELVMESNWANKDEPEKMRLSIYQTDLQYALMKCIQEQQAMIEELKQEVAKLKGV